MANQRRSGGDDRLPNTDGPGTAASSAIDSDLLAQRAYSDIGSAAAGTVAISRTGSKPSAS